MARIDQELRIFRSGREEGTTQANVDGDDSRAMEALLRGWLRTSSWGPSTWGDFTIVSYEPRRREVRLSRGAEV